MWLIKIVWLIEIVWLIKDGQRKVGILRWWGTGETVVVGDSVVKDGWMGVGERW